ncbi:arylamine N-acetyltransferase family protein [Marilutibacter maris]|uniref:N-hydroxyarylamine O-acetyltransferase n=1 Tax=Marilutibacter maris TaxID=1605891 RepID=A0A2U9T7C1_9GAMM|nr:arylamine N-acetyltransferase [Lysobacter maris]AWV08616.1 N-hydroxyarylamine O-acetyltransferase [Lysobacter maris]
MTLPPHEDAAMATPLTDMDLYLQRLGFDAPPAPSLDTLGVLQRRHTAAFVFENIASFMHAPVPIDLPALQRKLLHEGRGGYCYELNGLFLALLQQLGFEARALTARVVMGTGEDALTARTHQLALVTIDGVAHVSDVGFGGMVPTAPLRLDTEAAQATAHEPYRLLRRGDGYLLSAQVGDEWRPMYVFDLQPQAAIDLEVGNWYVATHPDSGFRHQLRAARTGPGYRKTLRDGSFAIHRTGADSERRELADADAVIEVLRREFELRLPQGPALRERIAGHLASAAAAAA